MDSENRNNAILGKEVVVTLNQYDANGNITGQSTELVRIKEITVAQHQRALAAVDDSIEWIAFCTGKTTDWVKKLSYTSLTELDTACTEVNEGFFMFLDNQQKRQFRRMQSLSVEEIQKLSELAKISRKD